MIDQRKTHSWFLDKGRCPPINGAALGRSHAFQGMNKISGIWGASSVATLLSHRCCKGNSARYAPTNTNRGGDSSLVLATAMTSWGLRVQLLKTCFQLVLLVSKRIVNNYCWRACRSSCTTTCQFVQEQPQSTLFRLAHMIWLNFLLLYSRQDS